MKTLLFCCLLFCVCYAEQRHVDCSLAHKPVSPAQAELYQFAFQNFVESDDRSGGDSLNFDSLITLATLPMGGADLTEALVTIRRIEREVDPGNVTLTEVKRVWFNTWTELADELVKEGEMYESDGDHVSASSAFRRASAYLQLGERFCNHSDPVALSAFRRSMAYFEHSVELYPGPIPCRPVSIPYIEGSKTYSLRSYWCDHKTKIKRGTIVLMNGYDGSVENSVYEVAAKATDYGFDVVTFEGPGQGAMPRFHNLYFRPDWEAVASSVVDYVESVTSPGKIVFWGRSFGGYLSPRAFSFEPRAFACIADGGVYDFFQMLFCHFPNFLRDLLYTDETLFNKYIGGATKTSLSLDFMINYGYLGFGVDTPSDLFTKLMAYWFGNGALEGTAGRPLLAYDPSYDDMAGNQTQIFFSHLPSPSDQTKMLTLDPMRGAALHCAVGSTSNELIAMMKWLQSVVPEPPSPSPPRPGKPYSTGVTDSSVDLEW